jgi:hypothetical protein
VINQIIGMADMFGQFGPSPVARKEEGVATKPLKPAEPKEEKPIKWKEVKFDATAAIVREVVRVRAQTAACCVCVLQLSSWGGAPLHSPQRHSERGYIG